MKEKNVLLFYYYYHHHIMVERLAASMRDYHINVDVICMDNFHLVKNSDISLNIASRMVLTVFKKCKSNFILRVARKLCCRHLLNKLISHYDLVDFHAYSLDYLPYMQFCKDQDIPYDISLWGSEIMRASEEALEKKKWGFEHCRFIKSSENLLLVVDEKYTGLFKEKYRTCYFGNSGFEVIDDVSESKVFDFRNYMLANKEEFVVTCGYNGSDGQNHLAIVETIKSLPKEIRMKTSFLFPMTYGATQKYLSTVRSALEEACVHYTIIDKYISSEEIAVIRLASDVVVNIQKTDAFSGSLKEHLYCNNVLIIGEWLNYITLEKNNVFYIKSSITDLSDKLKTVLSDLPKYKVLCMGNHDKMANITSWPVVLPVWANTYNS